MKKFEYGAAPGERKFLRMFGRLLFHAISLMSLLYACMPVTCSNAAVRSAQLVIVADDCSIVPVLETLAIPLTVAMTASAWGECPLGKPSGINGALLLEDGKGMEEVFMDIISLDLHSVLVTFKVSEDERFHHLKNVGVELIQTKQIMLVVSDCVIYDKSNAMMSLVYKKLQEHGHVL